MCHVHMHKLIAKVSFFLPNRKHAKLKDSTLPSSLRNSKDRIGFAIACLPHHCCQGLAHF